MDVLADRTSRTEERWTLTCSTVDGRRSEHEVLVDRGRAVDVGEACGA